MDGVTGERAGVSNKDYKKWTWEGTGNRRWLSFSEHSVAEPSLQVRAVHSDVRCAAERAGCL